MKSFIFGNSKQAKRGVRVLSILGISSSITKDTVVKFADKNAKLAITVLTQLNKTDPNCDKTADVCKYATVCHEWSE